MLKTSPAIAQAYIRYYTLGATDDYWAVEELHALVRGDPDNAWAVIREINASPIDTEWRELVLAGVGAGPLEELIVLHEATFLDKILTAAEADATLRAQLATIYESSVDPDVFARINSVLHTG